MAANIVNRVSLVSRETLRVLCPRHTGTHKASSAVPSQRRNRTTREASCKGQWNLGNYRVSLRALTAEGQTAQPVSSGARVSRRRASPAAVIHPFTLILENDSTACPAVGRPINVAG